MKTKLKGIMLALCAIALFLTFKQPDVKASDANIKQVDPSMTSITVTWDAPTTQKTGRKMYIGIGDTLDEAAAMAKARTIEISDTTTTYTFTGLKPSTKYHIKITEEYYKYGLFWDNYYYACDEFYTTPDKVTNVYQTNNWDKDYRIDWDELAEVSGYEYEFYIGKTLKKNAEVGTGVFAYGNVKDASKSNANKIRVRAFTTINNEKYYGEWSDYVYLLKNSDIKSSKKGYNVSVKKGKLNVKWNKTKYASGYIIYVSTNERTGYTAYKVKGGKKTSATIKKLNGSKFKKNNTYYVAVRPYKTIGSKTIYGTIGCKVYIKSGYTRSVTYTDVDA
ncbi:MAG: fibronectin type III domain-containing protein [Butyrivibrio sp.]|nr:fibronectin type III domain-containing protein [Butyrivibrio sp.]